MNIFSSPDRIFFGPKIDNPNIYGFHPREARFIRGNSTGAYEITWPSRQGVVGYHIFRSQSVNHIKSDYMRRFHEGSYKDAIKHFIIGENCNIVIDEYKLFGANMMFYWVVAQDSYSHLKVVDDVAVNAAGPMSKHTPHFLLAPDSMSKPAAPAAPAVAPVSAAPQQNLRHIGFTNYQPQEMFKIVKDAIPADSYFICVSNQLPSQADGDAVWDGVALAGSPVRVYSLPGRLEGFRMAGAPGFVAVLANLQGGSKVQAPILKVTDSPGVITELS